MTITNSSTRNVALAVACAFDGRPKYVIAVEAGMTPNLLSAYISGKKSLPDHHRERLSSVLKADL